MGPNQNPAKEKEKRFGGPNQDRNNALQKRTNSPPTK